MSTKVQKKKNRQAKEAAAVSAVANDDQVNPYARQHGSYQRDGNRGVLNRGGTPIARWRAAGLLTEPQINAIDLCVRLWDRAGTSKRLVQDLLRVVGLPHTSGMAQQEALDELQWFKDRIPHAYWQVFENVCRFDEPAGVAGSKLATNRRSAEIAAKTCVCFVADLIAQWKHL